MRRTPLILIALMLLGVSVTPAQQGGYTNPFDDPDVPDWSDEKVLEYVEHPEAQVRLYASCEILRRWETKPEKILALLKADWEGGIEVLCAGGWQPHHHPDVERYLLEDVGRTPAQRDEAVHLLARSRTPPDSRLYTSGVGELVRDAWFAGWMKRIPHSVFYPGPLDLMLTRPWVRRRFYTDGEWCRSWGSYIQADKTWYHGWQLREYRQVVQLLAGEPTDEERLRTNQFLLYLRAAILSGKNACDVEMFSQHREQTDLLPSTVSVEGVAGRVAYAYLVAIVLRRPDWVPAIHARLQKTVRITQVPVLDPVTGQCLRFEDKRVLCDNSSALVMWMSRVAELDLPAVKAGLGAYWRREWPEYKDMSWNTSLWSRHPWLQGIRLDKEFLVWYEKEGGLMPPASEVDLEFLRGE